MRVQSRYPIKVVARLTGLPADTLRAWERRYRAVEPERSSRGRLYSDAEIQRLLSLRRAVEKGYAIGQIAGLGEKELAALVDSAAAEVQPRSSESTREVYQPALDAIHGYDFATAEKTLIGLATLLDPGEFAEEVALPFMSAVGALWHRGAFNVSQEHMASAIVRNLLGSVLRTRATIGMTGPRMMIATPAGELHEFGIMAAALLAAAYLYPIFYFGPNLPGRDIVDTANRTGLGIVLLGVSQPQPSRDVIDEVRLVANNLGDSMELWIGGPAAHQILTGVERKRTRAILDFTELRNSLAKGKQA